MALVVELGVLELEHLFDVLLDHLGLRAMMIVLLHMGTLLPPYLVWDGQFGSDDGVPTSHRVRLSRRLASEVFYHLGFDDLLYLHGPLVFLEVPLLILDDIFRAQFRPRMLRFVGSEVSLLVHGRLGLKADVLECATLRSGDGMQLGKRAFLPGRETGRHFVGVLLEADGLKRALQLLPLLPLIEIEFFEMLKSCLVNFLLPQLQPQMLYFLLILIFLVFCQL